MPGGFGWLKFGAAGKCTGFGLGMDPTTGATTRKPFLQSEIGPPANSYGCCTAVAPNRRGAAPTASAACRATRHSADCSYYIDNDVQITVPVWDVAGGQGANAWYHIVGFAGMQLTACDGGKDIEGVLRQLFLPGAHHHGAAQPKAPRWGCSWFAESQLGRGRAVPQRRLDESPALLIGGMLLANGSDGVDAMIKMRVLGRGALAVLVSMLVVGTVFATSQAPSGPAVSDQDQGVPPVLTADTTAKPSESPEATETPEPAETAEPAEASGSTLSDSDAAAVVAKQGRGRRCRRGGLRGAGREGRGRRGGPCLRVREGEWQVRGRHRCDVPGR